MALHLHEGQMFRDKDGDTYVLQFRPDSTIRLAPVVLPNPNPLTVAFYLDAVEFADEVEAGIWVPFDPESTFVGLRPTTRRDAQRIASELQSQLYRADIGTTLERIRMLPDFEKEVQGA